MDKYLCLTIPENTSSNIIYCCVHVRRNSLLRTKGIDPLNYSEVLYSYGYEQILW